MLNVRFVSRVLIAAAALAAAWPLAEAVQDWVELSGYHEDANTRLVTGSRGAGDWVVWDDVDGAITASHVFPKGPGYAAGIRDGDVLFLWDNQQYFDALDLKNAMSGLSPGVSRPYLLTRGTEFVEVSVELTRHPTFLYPRSMALWQFSLWGFTLGAFFHALGLFIAGPLARHNPSARFELVLIAVSSLWIFGNLLRLLAVQVFGPPDAGTLYDLAFQVTTTFGLIGWVGFPFLLLIRVASAAGLLKGHRAWLVPVIVCVPMVLAAGMLVTLLVGSIGPVSIEDLLVPILFYASCYIGMAAVVALLNHDEATGDWGRAGSVIIALMAAAAALAVQGVIPVLSALSEQATGWMIVSAQLLAVVPVTIYTVGTLQFGKVDEILSRAFVYTLVLGLIFFAFVGGMTVLDPMLERTGASRIVVEGLFVVLLLVLFERLGRRLQIFASSFFSAERHQARVAMSRFLERITEFLDAETLASEAIAVAGSAVGARSAVLFLRAPSDDQSWIVGQFRPEPPYVTEQVFRLIWPHFRDQPAIWARNPELNKRHLPGSVRRLMLEHGAGLAVPVRGDGHTTGMLVFGMKSRRGAVYNLDDLELLRSFALQVGLAVDRLQLVEREKRLAAETSEAHLVALRAQINPHFLFNSLNTIISLISERPGEAEAVVENLSAIFRYTLQTGGKAFVPVRDEIALVERYLHIEKARFGERLTISCEVDPDAADVPVPAFTIQTLVENAIKHGIEKVRGPGRLSISVCTSEPDQSVVVDIVDTGAGIQTLFGRTEPATGNLDFFGTGLSNVYERVGQLYGRDDLLSFVSSPDAGTVVRLKIPSSSQK